RRNVVRPEEFPYETGLGPVLAEGSYLTSVDRLEQAVGYEGFVAEQARARRQGRHLGLGVSVFNESSGVGSQGLQQLGMPVTTHDTARVRMDPSGKVTVVLPIASQGQGHATTMAQVAADALGVLPEDVTVLDVTSANGYGMGTWASRGAVIGAGSLLRAADVVRRKLMLTAAHLLEASAEDIVLEDRKAHVAGSPDRTMPIADLAGIVYFAGAVRPPDLEPTLEATAAYDPASSVYSNGAHAAVVEVDVETGVVRIERFVVVEDCGPMINPMIVEGQIRGGVAQAIGGALLEEMVYDDNGQLLTTTLMDYVLPTAVEVPAIEIHHLETPSEITPGGIKGMGESAMIAAPYALLGAVNDALAPLGALVLRLPVTPERVLDAIAAAGA
ncbi:MAG: xanthine dehydrogenase family protein molybdopterin-binding subunit, partial [Actinobacteria bacterium]|nr:xanthine dehydrogenase family protein molybdopterin-binding subunit [Actinomycetota bacterium]